jgi:hypothetical protein
MCQPAQVFDHAAGRLYFALFDVRDEIKYDNVRFLKIGNDLNVVGESF